MISDYIHLGSVIVLDEHAKSGNDDGIVFEQQLAYNGGNHVHRSHSLGMLSRSEGVSMASPL